jgi:hypothetical protein
MTESGTVNMNVKDPITGYTALMISTYMGYVDDVKLLLAAGIIRIRKVLFVHV